MALRKYLLGLAGAIAVAGVTTAEPPVNPLVEGREPDPVTRDFHLLEVLVGGYVSSSEVSERVNPGLWPVLALSVWQVMFDQITIPLGTALMTDELPVHRQ